jgi:hypothetical protein
MNAFIGFKEAIQLYHFNIVTEGTGHEPGNR